MCSFVLVFLISLQGSSHSVWVSQIARKQGKTLTKTEYIQTCKAGTKLIEKQQAFESYTEFYRVIDSDKC